MLEIGRQPTNHKELVRDFNKESQLRLKGYFSEEVTSKMSPQDE